MIVDGSLSDTAVGLQGFDRTRRSPSQRSPKSETPTRERDRFGNGMGKKSNSTSQLSATGKLISSHITTILPLISPCAFVLPHKIIKSKRKSQYKQSKNVAISDKIKLNEIYLLELVVICIMMSGKCAENAFSLTRTILMNKRRKTMK